MTLEFHPAVQKDFNAAIAYCESNAGIFVADRFEAEVRAALAAIKAARQFPFYDRKLQMRRVRLRHFPYVSSATLRTQLTRSDELWEARDPRE